MKGRVVSIVLIALLFVGSIAFLLGFFVIPALRALRHRVPAKAPIDHRRYK